MITQSLRKKVRIPLAAARPVIAATEVDRDAR
jgi:hypothetical protein